VIPTEELINFVKPILDTNTPEGYTPIDNRLIFFRLSEPAYGADGLAHWSIIAQRKVQVSISANQAVDLVKGLTLNHAVDNLERTLPVNQHPKIMLSPSWWPRLPFLTMRINLVKLEVK
jgi:hypothetical protein